MLNMYELFEGKSSKSQWHVHFYVTNFGLATLKKGIYCKETSQRIASSCGFPLILLDSDKSGSDLHVYGAEMEHQSTEQYNIVMPCLRSPDGNTGLPQHPD